MEKKQTWSPAHDVLSFGHKTLTSMHQIRGFIILNVGMKVGQTDERMDGRTEATTLALLGLQGQVLKYVYKYTLLFLDYIQSKTV